MTNNMKKIICLGISATVVATAFAGCSAAKTSGKEEHTVAVTEIVTNSEGEAVTDESGEVVTEVVTDKNGLPVTKVVKGDASSSTSANSSTAAKSNGATKAGSTKAGATKTASKGKSSATAAQSKNESVKIVLEENRRASCSSKNVEIESGIVTIKKGGNYRISSSTKAWHGQIVLKLKETESAEIAFENVTISNDSKNILRTDRLSRRKQNRIQKKITKSKKLPITKMLPRFQFRFRREHQAHLQHRQTVSRVLFITNQSSQSRAEVRSVFQAARKMPTTAFARQRA